VTSPTGPKMMIQESTIAPARACGVGRVARGRRMCNSGAEYTAAENVEGEPK
jgi:hypothetical protein